jgi:hypothetical protein
MKSPYEMVSRYYTTSANPMTNTEAQPNYTSQQILAEYGNMEQAEQNFQGLYKPVMSDPCVNGKASHRFVAPWNYFGYLYIPYRDNRVVYNVGLPTGGGRDPFPPLLPPKKYSLSGR